MTILHCMSAFRKNALNCCKQLTSIVHPDGVNLGCFQIGKLLFRNVHYPPELPDEEVELLKILERYLQSLRDGTTSDCRKNFDYGCCMVVQKLVRMNVFEVCKCISFDKGKLKILKGEFRCLKDKPAVQLDQLNVINNLEPALPSTQSSSESGENDNQKKVAYIINEDPTLERYCILRTTPTLQEFQKACAIEDARKEKEKLSGVKNKSSVKDSTKKTTSKVKSKANLKSETLETDEKKNYFSRSLCSYIQVCGSTGMVNLAHKAVLYYRYKSQIQKKSFSFMNMNIYNALLNCWAELGNMEKVEEVFTLMEEDGFTPDLQAYASYLECLVSYQGHLSTTAQSKVREISAALEKQGKKFSDIFRDCIFNRDQLQKIIKVYPLLDVCNPGAEIPCIYKQSHIEFRPIFINLYGGLGYIKPFWYCLLDIGFCKKNELLAKCEANNSYLSDDPLYNVLEPVFPDIANQNIQISHAPYDCDLLKNLYEGAVKSPFLSTSISGKNAIELTNKQLKLEADYFVKIKSVNAPKSDSKRTKIMRLHLTQCEQKFRKEALSAIGNKLSNMWDDVKGQKCMLLYPYLHAVDKETLVHLLLQEIRLLAESAEYFSANIRIMCSLIGHKIMNSYFISLRKRNKVSDKIAFIHSKYVEYLLNPELVAQYTPREYWEYLKKLYFEGPTIDTSDVSWPHHILYEVGKFLYEILLEHLTFNPSMFQSKTQPRVLTRPFFTMYERGEKVSSARNSVRKLSLEIRAHPKLCKLYEEAKLEQLEFEASMVPMVCPPRPWVKLQAGGLLMTSVPFIRLPPHAHQQNAYYTKIPNEHLFPCFDSLNNLSLCPWIMNKPVLDAIIKVFQSGGCIELDIPLNPEKFSNGPKVTAAMTDKEKAKTRREKAIFKKEKLESGSLWFDCLYKLSIANHFRDMIFWFPHNLDFRGRVYPTPPHFNHLGSDLVRSMLLFAEGRPLGQNGLNWLKIHLINLTGLKKRESNSERLRYADEILEDILDSADKPFTGRQWWRTSDEPWQTLACCKEIANAVRSPDPVTYISHFPVHQDGSCNGLQHYAALGLDDFGAKEVEEERKKDAAEGNEIAQALEGFVKRKVVKQTIMTFVYGVTEYGAKQQILKQLKDTNFSEELCNQASRYLMKQTFASIQKMFTATREIQKWFTNSAECITKLCGEPVEWITPLGLPVIQPYHRKTTIHTITDFLTTRKSGVSSTFYGTAKASYESTYETYQLPNVRKQKNAFPPNFIHSLDSSHMMLTSLFCQRKGITFVSVHDCYWTHPQTIEIMNKVCREQFVSLHSQPILEDLSKFFLQKYVPGDNSQLSELQIQKLKSVLSVVPKKGSFNLQHILNSVYFFS